MHTRYLVVIPLYNHASAIAGVVGDVLARCSGSFAAQGGLQLLVVDDGSTDGGGEIAGGLIAEAAGYCSANLSEERNNNKSARSEEVPGDESASIEEAPGGSSASCGSAQGTARCGKIQGAARYEDHFGCDVALNAAASPVQANAADAAPRLHLLRHERNRGKGEAILSAAEWAAERGFTHIITLDADGQHKAEDLPAMLHESQLRPQAVIVGARDFSVRNVPGASRFGRSFSGFWMRVQTGLKVSDMQSGFRVYPVSILRSLKFSEKRFAFEMEVLVKAAWSGFEIISHPVRVYYPERSERVSHFRKFYDNFRITLMNTKLTVRALIPLPFIKREHDEAGRVSVLHPLESLRRLLLRKNTPFTLAASTFAAVLINILPLIGLQSVITLLAIGWFRLNRLWTLTVHHALWPPLIIPFCVEGGHFLLHGRLLTEISWATIAGEARWRILEWVLGGLVFGPLLALLGGALVYFAAFKIRRGLKCAQTAVSGERGSDGCRE